MLPNDLAKLVKDYLKGSKSGAEEEVHSALSRTPQSENGVTLEIDESRASVLESFFDDRIKRATDLVEETRRRIAHGKKPTVVEGPIDPESALEIYMDQGHLNDLCRLLVKAQQHASNLSPTLFRDLQMQLQVNLFAAV